MAGADTFAMRVIHEELKVLGILNLIPTPYDSHPSAKESLEKLHLKLLLDVENLDVDIEHRAKSCLAAISYQLGRIYYDTDKRECAETMFLKATTVVKNHESKPNHIVSVISSYNMLAFINITHHENYEEALRYLLEAQRLYDGYSVSNSGPATRIYMLLPTQCKNDNKRLITNQNPLVGARIFTLFYLIDVYKKRNMIDEVVISTHLSLKLQLEYQMLLQTPVDWAQGAAVLSNFFVRKNAYKQARHHLAASSTFMESIIPMYYNQLYK